MAFPGIFVLCDLKGGLAPLCFVEKPCKRISTTTGQNFSSKNAGNAYRRRFESSPKAAWSDKSRRKWQYKGKTAKSSSFYPANFLFRRKTREPSAFGRGFLRRPIGVEGDNDEKNLHFVEKSRNRTSAATGQMSFSSKSPGKAYWRRRAK